MIICDNKKAKGLKFGKIYGIVNNAGILGPIGKFEKLDIKFVKKPDDGKMKGLAFIVDPDSYWIEILQVNMIEKNSA